MEIALDPFNGLFANGDDPFLAAFADRAEEAGFEIDIAEFDVGDFADAQAGGVHKLQHCLVAQAELRARVGRGQQAPDFFVIEHVWKCAPEFRRVDGLRDVRCQKFFAGQKAAEHTNRGEVTREAARA